MRVKAICFPDFIATVKTKGTLVLAFSGILLNQEHFQQVIFFQPEKPFSQKELDVWAQAMWMLLRDLPQNWLYY